MQIDPSQWMVSLAGFTYDWIITREWKRILWSMIPLLVLCTVGGLVWWGKHLDRNDLAQWYMDLGDQEIAGWEQAWAPPAAEENANPADAVEVGQAESTAAGTNTDTENTDPESKAGKPSQVSEFAELLFRRVQLLAPTDRSQFVIGATLAQRGAAAQAKLMLTKIAPDTAAGYAPAHALLAQLYLQELQQQSTASPEQIQLLMHHVSQAKRWDRVPRVVLRAGSELAWRMGDPSKAMSLMAQSAERTPEDNFELARLAKTQKNTLIFEQAFTKAEEFFSEALESDPTDIATRMKLVELYALDNQLDRAEQLLRDGESAESKAEIARGLSEIYRLRYANSFKPKDTGGFEANIQLLDQAMRLDPNNPLVVEEISKLARIQGPNATEGMIELLQSSLAEGKSTAATHAWLAEAYLVKKDFRKAIPHLELYVQRLPNAAQYLNNLAYVLADLYPERLEEALEYAKRSVAAAAAAKRPNPDFYDTLGIVYSKLNRSKEAVTALETAIELDRNRIDFHERVAVEYLRLGNQDMADKHRVVIQRLKEAQAAENTDLSRSAP